MRSDREGISSTQRETRTTARPASRSVLGNVADARVEHLSRASIAYVLSPYLDAAALALAKAGDRLDELRLAVAVDSGNADDLARSHLEGDSAHLGDVTVVAHM